MTYSFREFDQDAAATDTTDTNKGIMDNMAPEVYYALALAEEAGEVAGKIKKVYRDNNGVFTDEKKTEIILELGDCLWYMSRLAVRLGCTLALVAMRNVMKLRSRARRGVMGGSGDHR